jgi:hypothetical protein
VGCYLVFGQEESVPVLEEVNAPGLHRASPAKIHTSQVDLFSFRQNYNFHKIWPVGFAWIFATKRFHSRKQHINFRNLLFSHIFPSVADPDLLVRDTDPALSIIKQK